MFWLYLAIAIIGGLALFTALLFWFIRWLSEREPYSTLISLRTMQKLTFFRLLLRDKEGRVPLYVKLIAVGVAVYLATPFDIIPDFVPVVGWLDDIAIVLLALVAILKLTPRNVVLDMLQEAERND